MENRKPRWKCITDISNREIGLLSTSRFRRAYTAATENQLLHLSLQRSLGHDGPVNAVRFNESGDHLLAGCDDSITLWDANSGMRHIKSESTSPIMYVTFLPHSEENIAYSSSRGQVYHGRIREGGMRKNILHRHKGRVHQLAPGSPHVVYTCGEDRVVNQIDLRQKTVVEIAKCQVRLYAIATDPRNSQFIATGGSDPVVRLYDNRRFGKEPLQTLCPDHLISDTQSGITGLDYSTNGEILATYHNDFTYLFKKDELSFPCVAYRGHRNRSVVTIPRFIGPASDHVASGSDCGRIFLWKKDTGKLIRVLENANADGNFVCCVDGHPAKVALASGGSEQTIKLWTPDDAVERAILPENILRVRPGSWGLMNLQVTNGDIETSARCAGWLHTATQNAGWDY